MRSRALVALPAILLAFFASPARADNQSGVNYVLFDNWTNQYNAYNASPPIPPTTRVAASGTVPRVEFQWGNGPIMGTNLYEDVIIRFDAWIKPPTSGVYQMCVASDDGARMFLDDMMVINDWFDRGGGCWQIVNVDFIDGQAKRMILWWYENGGGAHVMLRYSNGQSWQVVPDSWFTLNEPALTTTTTTTTVPPTTTTEASTTTTEPPSTTTEPATTTTTSTSSITTSTTTTTEAPPPQTTTTTQVPSPATTTSTTTTEPPTTTTESPTTTTEASTTTIGSTTTIVQTTVPEITTSTTTSTTTTVLETTTTTTTTTVFVVPERISVEQAVNLIVTAPLEDVPLEQLEEIFATIEPELLTVAEGEAVAQALNAAPDEVKKTFEDKINVFAGVFDSYRMVGQTIDVGQRRTLIAVASSLVAVGPTLRRRK